MTWTDDTWSGFCLLLQEWWTGELTDNKRLAWKIALNDFEPAEVVGLLKSMLRRGGTWRPTVAEFVAALEEKRAGGVQSFDEIWPGVVRALSNTSHCTGFAGNGPTFDDDSTLAEIEQRSGRLAAGWCARYGLDRLRAEPVNDPDHGGAVLHRMRASFAEMTERAESRDRLLTALDAPRSAGELRKPDMAGLIGGPS